MISYRRIYGAFCLLATAVVSPAVAQHPEMPPGMTHEQHLGQMKRDEELKRRGGAVMGFDQDKTVHHFRLKPDGGSIEVTARSAADAETRDQVRAHLKEIAAEFSNGAFDKPFATHGEEPPGVREM